MAAVAKFDDDDDVEYAIVCWSYPSGEILFQKTNLDEPLNRIEWNPFRLNVFATFLDEVGCLFPLASCDLPSFSNIFDQTYTICITTFQLKL